MQRIELCKPWSPAILYGYETWTLRKTERILILLNFNVQKTHKNVLFFVNEQRKEKKPVYRRTNKIRVFN